MSKDVFFYSVPKDTPPEHIPFALTSGTKEEMEKAFEGPVAKPGDTIGFYCYEATETHDGQPFLKFRYKVISHE